jgi:CubicO group peptidase (beta-lactamase class C family)
MVQTQQQSPEAVGISSQRLERIKPAMQAYIDKGLIKGINTMILRRGQVVHAESFGWRDQEANLPMQADTIFRFYSMTKPIICTALMTLYEEGRFLLTDPVAKYIPAFGSVKVMNKDGTLSELSSIMTVRDLMAHTSGLTYDFLEDYPVAELYREAKLMNDGSRTLEAIIDELAKLPLAFQPGTSWHYSLGIDVAAHLIQIISGQALGEFLKERLFTPLGMEDTAFAVPAEKKQRLSAMYGLPDLFGPDQTFSKLFQAWTEGYNERIDVSGSYPDDQPDTFARGGIGLYGTIGDYARFAQMLLSGKTAEGERILSRKTLELMHSNHIPAALLPYTLGGMPNPGYGFGLGSRVALDPAAAGVLGSVGEFGWAGAAKTYYWVDPREEMVGLYMCQSMMSFETPDAVFRALAYQAIID